MQRLEVSCAVRLIYTSLGAKGLTCPRSKILSSFLLTFSVRSKRSHCFFSSFNRDDLLRLNSQNFCPAFLAVLYFSYTFCKRREGHPYTYSVTIKISLFTILRRIIFSRRFSLLEISYFLCFP